MFLLCNSVDEDFCCGGFFVCFGLGFCFFVWVFLFFKLPWKWKGEALCKLAPAGGDGGSRMSPSEQGFSSVLGNLLSGRSCLNIVRRRATAFL